MEQKQRFSLRKNKLKLGLSLLTVLATPIAVNAVVSHDVNAEYRESIFYNNNKPANWWYSDGEDWYFFQNGKKLTGYGKDNAGTHYFVNGKYANGKIGNKEYRDGKEISVENKVPTRAYANGVYYVDAKPANWWYDDGTNWYFFQNGKKLTGYGKDNAGTHYFVNGKYANWWYDDGTNWYFFQNGKKLTGYGKDNAGTHYFVNGKYANWWYDDGTNWYFFQNGKKLTGYGKDNAGTHYFVNGKYANWWYDDGTNWYFFQNGKKLTGYGKDNAGTHYFVNGKYANGLHNGKYYLNGQVSTNASALNMPQYYQWDARWGRKVYGIGTMAQSGCVPTSLAMVFNGLGQKVLPTAVADTIYYNTKEMNVRMLGTSGKGAVYAINAYGYKHSVITSKAQLIATLQSGKPVFGNMGSGIFASGSVTHAIILSGYQNGKTKAMDPYTTYNTGRWYDVNTIWNQRSTDPYDNNIGGTFVAIG